MGREITITLPTMHVGQVAAFNSLTRYTAVRCGRRFGKSVFLQILACDAALKGQPVAVMAPDYKRLSEFYASVADILLPVTKSSSQVAGIIKLITGGSIEFWTLNDESAGRSRHYSWVFLDEAAFTKPKIMLDIWERAIKPTLFDLSGRCVVASNTNGVDDDNFLYAICHDPKYNFTQFHAPTSSNPDIPKRLPGEAFDVWQDRRQAELDLLRTQYHPLVYQQEIQAEFVDFRDASFFALPSFLVDDMPVEAPQRCGAVFAVVDTAIKTGSANDGSAVVYCAINRHQPGAKLYVLDWDIVQIEGSLLEVWLPSVLKRAEELSTQYQTLRGSLGVWIEDASSGSILLQQAARHGWQSHAIDTALTSKGKDERAINVSGYVYRGEVKLTPFALNKTTTHKGTTRNHFLSQVCGFRIGDKDAAKRADDLLDCMTYSVSIALGDAGGF